MMKKLYYEAPEAECMDVAIEKGFLIDSDPQSYSTNGSGFGERGNMEKDYTSSDGWSWNQ